MKKILLISLLSAVVFFLWINREVQSPSLSSTSAETDVEHLVIEQNKKPELSHDSIEANHESVDFYAEQEKYVSRCGVDNFNDFYVNALKESKNEISDLTESQHKALEYLTSDEFCGNWYQHVGGLAESDKDKLHELNRNPSLIGDAFDSLSKIEKSTISKSALRDESTDINKRMALHHLLTEDYEFIKQVADEINTANLSLITGSSMELMLLFECQENPEICSAQSSQMQSRCVFNDDHCNISYEGYLERTHTANEVSDFYNILAAVRRLLKI